ncbi:TPR-like protein [Suillus bovinus]|uniref:TPR-like protein n=1 Tax=Suillus bovinus TaxID=48563 RepID=UPI001B883691|nr:TPR-like protein [Suillus bovinus]KAG2156443.1 TPR-like protein [Suillus bovinus]
MYVLFSEESNYPERTQHLGEIHFGRVQQVIITAIRATYITLGLRWIPAGFHAVVKTDGAEYQTSNKSVHVDQAIVEWHERILLPGEPSSKIRVSIFASFELGPMLCHGELLRTFEISVGELLDRSESSHPIIFQPKQEEVVSACDSLSMIVERQLSDQTDAAVLCPLTTLTSRNMDVLALRTDAGHRLLARYHRTQNSRDLNQSIKHFERALNLCPMDHPCHPAALFILATTKFISCQANGTYVDLDVLIPLFQEALDLRPMGHPDQPITQLHFAISLLSRFAKRGFQTDADMAEELLCEILDVCHADSHIYRAALIAIETFALHSAGSIVVNDLEQERPATSMLLLAPDQLADRAKRCMQRDVEPHELDEVISSHYNAVGYYNTGHACRWQLLCNLAAMLHARFKRRGGDKDLDQAIALYKEVLAMCPVGHTDRTVPLNNLANGLSTRFEHRGNDKDLDQAITLHREALALHPVGHPYRFASLNNLANRLSIRFEHRGNVEDLDKAIALHKEALALCAGVFTDRSMSLNNLANKLSTRFEHQGNAEDLDQAIALHRESLALRPVGHTDRSISLNNLAKQLFIRFEHRGNDEDVDQAIALCREALALCPVGHTYRFMSLNTLATQLSTRFKHQGNDEDLDQAIAINREALALCPVAHTGRSLSLNNLATVLSIRFKRRGSGEDLDQAITLHRESLALRPVGHIDRSMSLNNLANQLSTRFEQQGNDEDLDQAITLHSEALALRPVGHADRSMPLNDLANQLSTRFERRGNEEDLDQAIALHREALALRPVGHTDRSKSLNNLASGLVTRFAHKRNREDLDESREHLCCALTLLTQHDPLQLLVHQSLAAVHLSFLQSGLDGTGVGEDMNNLNAAMYHFKAAANVVSGGLLHRLQASLSWARYADNYSHDTRLEAYATSMQLLDAHTSVTASVSSRRDAIKGSPCTVIGVLAASCALHSGDVHRAVEFLEQGRTVIWTQMIRLRTPLDRLQTCDDHAATLMKRFRDLSSILDKPPANHSKETSRADVEAEEIRYRCLVGDWNGTVEEIRKIDGFSHFLLPPMFSDLQDAAHDGPIIMLIAGAPSCNAIIIPHKQPPINIQLHTDLSKLTKLVFAFQNAVEKEAGPKGSQTALIKALRELWADVVPEYGGVRRVFFNFMPLHAAGEYRADGKSLSQQYISLYTPSLTALINARRSHDRPPSAPFVAIGQNRPAGALFTLDAVEPELELVRRLLPPPPTVSFSKLTSVDATKSRALCALQDNTWLHFACHGKQNHEPFESAFLMRDQPLSLLDITQMDLSQHQFAFLSACETAVGSQSTPDEVIHLAAGLQFAGVRSVIGTLWKVNDSTVQRLVEAFYQNFCGDGKMNPKRAAWALHQAVHSLACDKEIPLDQRIVFMHIGICAYF